MCHQRSQNVKFGGKRRPIENSIFFSADFNNLYILDFYGQKRNKKKLVLLKGPLFFVNLLD